jgi:hypothetical protein
MLAFTDYSLVKKQLNHSSIKMGEVVGMSKVIAHGFAGIVMYKNKYVCS